MRMMPGARLLFEAEAIAELAAREPRRVVDPKKRAKEYADLCTDVGRVRDKLYLALDKLHNETRALEGKRDTVRGR
jgi:hypothetical protein